MSANQGPATAPLQLARLLAGMRNATEDSHLGTAAELRRAIEEHGQQHSLSGQGFSLFREYAREYRAVLARSTLGFLHLSKSGGTGLCELAKLNGCSRAAAGLDTFGGNCVDRERFDGPWWMPDEVLRTIHPPGLRTFAERSFRVMPVSFRRAHECRNRGRQQAASGPNARWRGTNLSPVFFSIEGGAPEARRCPGVLEMLVLREPLQRLASFGRELQRWGLMPPRATDCNALPQPQPPLAGPFGKATRRRLCDELKRRVCANFSLMASMAPPVYDNQLTRALLGYDVYKLPFGSITREHYLRARDRLRRVDLLLLLNRRMERSLRTRLGWSSRGLDPKYRRASISNKAQDANHEQQQQQQEQKKKQQEQKHRGRAQLLRRLRDAAKDSVPAGAGGGAPPMCALSGPAAEEARQVNIWDLALYAEGVRLETLDHQFFKRPEVKAAVALGRESGGDATPEVGSVVGCGLLAEHRPELTSTAGPTGSTLGTVTLGQGGGSTPRHGADSGALPICIHRRFRNGCCWSVGSSPVPVPMPSLPWPLACVLPPAGRLSHQASIALPAQPFKHHHASCALSCAGHEAFGLEAAGSFCMCLSRAEVSAATPLSERECQVACSSAARIHRTWPGMPEPAPCGGSEAVAVFETDAVLRAMAKAAALREHRRRQQASTGTAAEMCQPMAEPCAVGVARTVRTLYVHAPKGEGHANGVVPDQRVILGCYHEATLHKHGITRKPTLAAVGPSAAGADGDVLRCSQGCAQHSYFAVGSERLVGGPCLCGDMPLVTWRRDAEGLEPLKARSLRRAN